MEILNFKVSKEIDGQFIELYPTVLLGSKEVILIDTGYEETYTEFIHELNKFNIQIKDITKILISHDDIDHIGALSFFQKENPSVEILCPEIEKESITGNTKSERLIQAESSLSNTPKEHQKWVLDFISKLQNIKHVQHIQRTFSNDVLVHDDLIVIPTPGHTKGHVSFYIPSKKTLIANDALVIENGELEIANPQFTLDMKQALKSIEVIKGLELNKIICYHGGIMKKNIQSNLEKLISKYLM